MKFYLLTTLFAFFCAKSIGIAQQAESDRCEPSNVAFIMDMSKTTKNYHRLEKKIVQQIVDKFPENSRFSLVTFGTRVFRRASFEPDMTAAKFKAIVAKLTGREEGSHSHLGSAVDAVPNFPIQKGKREKNYLFVLTDGKWTLAKKDFPQREQKIRDRASLITSQGVKTVVFGLGARADRNVLRGLVPIGQSEKNIINIRRRNYNADEIAAKVKQAVDKACTRAPAEPSCGKVVDIGFILDRSGSLGKNFKGELLPYVVNIIRTFNISTNGAHAGVLVFGSVNDVKVLIPLDKYYDTESLITDVLQIKYPRGESTYINKAFKVANDELFNYTPRPGVKRYAFLLTDGEQTYGKDPVWGKVKPEDEARKLWDKKVKIIAIGVGSVDKPSLERMTNNGKNGRVFTATSFTHLAKSIETVLNFFCEVCKMDLVVVLDTSGSTKFGFGAEKYVLLEIAKLVKLKQGGSKMSLITFATEGSLSIPFEERTYNVFEANVGQLYFRGGRTAIESGLNLVPEAMKTVTASNNNKKAVLVITDGLQTAGSIDEVKRQADAIRKKGYPIKTMSLHTKSWLKKRQGDPLRTLENISGSEENNFFISTPPNQNIENEAYQKEVEATVKKALHSICTTKEGSKK